MNTKKYILFTGLLALMFVSACGLEAQEVGQKTKNAFLAGPVGKVRKPDFSQTPEKLFCESREASCSCPTMLPRLMKCEYQWNASTSNCELVKVCLP